MKDRLTATQAKAREHPVEVMLSSGLLSGKHFTTYTGKTRFIYIGRGNSFARNLDPK